MHLTNWRDVEVVASTHAIGGLSLHDFVLAAKLDTIDVTYSPKWLRENAAVMMRRSDSIQLTSSTSEFNRVQRHKT